MKLVYLVVFVFFLSSCSQNSISTPLLNTDILKLEKSEKIWLNYKRKSNNSYVYFINFISWSGFGYETQIKVKKGIFTQRKYTSWNRTKENSWTENKKELGKHKTGAKLKLIDDLYEECKNILKTKTKSTNNIYLGFDEKGLLSNCLYAPKNCVDDCSNGIQIKEIKFIN